MLFIRKRTISTYVSHNQRVAHIIMATRISELQPQDPGDENGAELKHSPESRVQYWTPVDRMSED